MFHENSIPEIIDPPIKSPADLDKIPPFDINKGRTKVALEAHRICNEKIGDMVPMLTSVCGPFTWAAYLRGTYHFLADLKQNPQFAKDLIDLCYQGTVDTIKAYNELGMRAFLADAVATNYLISPAQIEEFYVPVYERLMNDLGTESFGGAMWTYYPSQAKGFRLPVLRDLGWWNYNYEPDEMANEDTIKEAKKYRDEYEVRLPILQNLWGKWVQSHSPREIEREVQRIIKLTGPELPFIVGMQSLPFGCPIENVDAYAQGVKKYGTFPLEG
jgi:uroporphyrinogen-III decarboxylase